MKRVCARDLGYYRQTEEIFNVLRDNEIIEAAWEEANENKLS